MNFIEILQQLNYASPISLLVGLIIAIYYRNRLDKLHKTIAFYLFLMLSVDITSRFIKEIFSTNLIMLLIYSFVELLFYLYLYRQCLFKKKYLSLSIIGVVGLLYILGEILLFVVFKELNPKEFQPYSKVVDNFIVILMALLFFHEKINAFNDTKWTNFRLNIAILLYFTINLLVFLPFNFLVNESTGLKFYFWTINLIITVLFYIYLTSLIWQNTKKSRVS